MQFLKRAILQQSLWILTCHATIDIYFYSEDIEENEKESVIALLYGRAARQNIDTY